MKCVTILTNVQVYSYRKEIRWDPRNLSSVFSLLLAYFEPVGKSRYIIVHKFLHLSYDNFHKVL